MGLGKKYWKIFDIFFLFYLFLVLVTAFLTISKTFYLNYGEYIMTKIGYEIKNREDLMNLFPKFNHIASPIVAFICFFLIY